MNEAAPQAAAGDDRDAAEQALVGLTADFGGAYEFGYDRDGWDAWPLVRWRTTLHAATAAELREKVTAEGPQ